MGGGEVAQHSWTRAVSIWSRTCFCCCYCFCFWIHMRTSFSAWFISGKKKSSWGKKCDLSSSIYRIWNDLHRCFAYMKFFILLENVLLFAYDEMFWFLSVFIIILSGSFYDGFGEKYQLLWSMQIKSPNVLNLIDSPKWSLKDIQEKWLAAFLTSSHPYLCLLNLQL